MALAGTESARIRIAIIVPRLEQLGPVILMLNLAGRLIESGETDIGLFYLDKHVSVHPGPEIRASHLDKSKFDFSSYDIIHTNGLRPDLLAFLHRRKIRRHVSTIHNFVFEDLGFTYNRLVSLVFGRIWIALWKKADKLVCVSGALKEFYLDYLPSSRLEVIHNGIEEETVSDPENDELIKAVEQFRSKGLTIIGTAGVLTRRKGIDQLLFLVSEAKNLALVIIGNGKELDALRSLAAKLEISDRCLFSGFVANARIYFGLFDFYMMPSRSEGFGLALVEAVQHKTPVICSDIKVFRELFSDEEVTFFKCDDLRSLDEALKNAVRYGKSKAEKAYSRYSENYTCKQMSENYLELYRSLV
jgi:L-malate glycosyltransferase